MARLTSRSAGTSPRGSDVARASGAGRTTVSHVMSGEQRASGQVRRRVLEPAEALGHRRTEGDATGPDDLPVAASESPLLTRAPRPFDETTRTGIRRLVRLVHAVQNPDEDPAAAHDPPAGPVVHA